MSQTVLATLYEVVGRRLGQTLSPEVASDIVGDIAAHFYPGPIEFPGVAPRMLGSYVLESQRLSAVLPQIKRLHQEHWQETEGHRHSIPFDMDYDRLLDTELQGRYFLFTATHHRTGELVGNMAGYTSRSVHTKTLMATEDTLFLSKEHRRGRLGIALMQYAEHALHAIGVRELQVSVKLVNSVGPMIERMGFKPVGTQYTKVLQEAANVLP